jgi:co-chaperonin GroES (HSP10)
MSLVLPRHVAASMRAAENIRKTSTHRIDADDWATVEDVHQQLQDLQDYMTQRREEEPSYHLPSPVGWKLMVLVLTIPEKSAGGVIIVDDAKEQRSLASPQGVVLKAGVDAFRDPERFNEPWCGVGDRISFVKYDAQMFQLANGQRLGFLNDTQPLSVIDSNWEVPT